MDGRNRIFDVRIILCIAAIGMLILCVISRGENPLAILLAFCGILWFVLLPGFCIARLVFDRHDSLLVDVVSAHLFGLALLPVVYHALSTVGAWEQYAVIQSILNIGLSIVVLRRRGNTRLGFSSIRRVFDSIITFAPVLFMVSCVVVAKYIFQLNPNDFTVRTTQEVDTAYLMGIVVSLRDYGLCLDLNQNAAALPYHFYTYLLLAILNGSTGCNILALFQIVLPLYSLSAFVLCIYCASVVVTKNRVIGIVAASAALLLDNWKILFHGFALTMPDLPNPMYYGSTLSALYVSPSHALSVGMILVVSVLLILQKRWNGTQLVVLGISIGLTAGYKGQAWMVITFVICLLPLLVSEMRKEMMLLSIVAILSGLGTIAFTSASATAQAAGSVSYARPIMENAFIQWLIGNPGKRILYNELNIQSLLAGMVFLPYWLLCAGGICIVWFIGKILHVKQILRWHVAEKIAFPAILLAAATAILFTPSWLSAPTYYVLSAAIYLCIPSVLLFVRDVFETRNRKVIGLIGLVLLLQMSSGILYVIQPVRNGKYVAHLGADWYRGMLYLRDHTPKHSRILSNRFNFSTKSSLYNDRYYFVSAISERVTIVSGKNYSSLSITDSIRYNALRAKADTILTTSNVETALRVTGDIGADYIVIDRWRGERINCEDRRFVTRVFGNTALDIYRVNTDH